MFYRRILIAAMAIILGLIMLISFTQAEEKNIPIRDFKEVAGKWEGKIDGDGWSAPATIIINNDGTIDIIVPEKSHLYLFSNKGHIRVKRELIDGKITSKNPTSGGMISIITLYEEGGKRIIKTQSQDGFQKGEFKLVSQ